MFFLYINGQFVLGRISSSLSRKVCRYQRSK